MISGLFQISCRRIVVIDDIHPKGDHDRMEFIQRMIEYRYNEVRTGATFITSNLSPEELLLNQDYSREVAERVHSRLKEIAVEELLKFIDNDFDSFLVLLLDDIPPEEFSSFSEDEYRNALRKFFIKKMKQMNLNENENARHGDQSLTEMEKMLREYRSSHRGMSNVDINTRKNKEQIKYINMRLIGCWSDRALWTAVGENLIDSG